MSALLGLLRKEMYHILRDRRTLIVIVALPILQVIIFGYAIRTDVDHVRLAIVDPAPDSVTLAMRARFGAARVFETVAVVPRIDLLVTDIYMPGRSGMELARELKAIRSELAVLMISGGVLDEAQMAGVQEEGWSFLAKPFRLTELLSTVHRILAPVEARRWREARRGVTADTLLRRD